MAFADLALDVPALQAAEDRIIRGRLGAAKRTIEIVTREYEHHLEDATRSAAGGNLWRAWASDIQPRGKRLAREPAGYIYLNGTVRTRGAIEFLTRSGTVQSQTGGSTAIPLPAAGSTGRSRNLTPGEWEAKTGIKLRYIYRGGNKPALLVADGTVNGRSGVFRRITRKRTAADARRGFLRGEQSVPIFILLAPRAFQGKFSVEAILDGSGNRLVQVFESESRADPG